MDYSAKCYELFMKGRDTFEELDAEVQSKLSKLSRFNEAFSGVTGFPPGVSFAQCTRAEVRAPAAPQCLLVNSIFVLCCHLDRQGVRSAVSWACVTPSCSVAF